MVVIKGIAEVLADQHGISKAKAEAIIRDTLGVIREELASGEDVFLSDFGKFKIELRPARQGRNPQNGEVIDIAEKNVIKFKPAKALDEAAN